jgi:NAD(P)-dependent dehydrogenase (short-subunit alcohol dehydrogenase family)
MGVDNLVNNAGISMRLFLMMLKPMFIKRVMDVNFWGTV